LDVFYKDPSNNKIKWHGSVNDSTSVVLAVNYENTKGTGDQGNVRLLKEFQWNKTGLLGLKLDVNADSTSDMLNGVDDLRMRWGLSSGRVASLGNSSDTEEGTELLWGSGQTAIGTKDEDHRTYYGIVIKEPKGQSSSDRVKLMIPNDQVFANIVIKGKDATVSSGGTGYAPQQITPKTMLDTEVSDPTMYNLIVVGGPCANSLAESLFGVSCADWPYQDGEALVKMVDNGNKVAMLVAGTSAADTRRAAKAVASETHRAKFSGSEVVVKGTTDSDITVETA
ncbi:S-layer protein, partial [Candidatus Woesearchaeota archaeon]